MVYFDPQTQGNREDNIPSAGDVLREVDRAHAQVIRYLGLIGSIGKTLIDNRRTKFSSFILLIVIKVFDSLAELSPTLTFRERQRASRSTLALSLAIANTSASYPSITVTQP